MADFNDFSTLDTQHQGDLVILGFENLISKYDQRTSQTPAFQTPLSETRRQIKLMNSKKDSLTRLYRHLLPLAQRQIRRLSELLVRIDSDEEPGSQLKLVFELQPELDHVLDQICAIREAAFLEALSDSHSSGAEDPGEHANLRLAGLNGISCNLLPKLVTYFREFCDLIKQTKFSSSGTTNNHTDINSSKTSVIGLRDQICEEIEEIGNNFLASDYDTSDLVIFDLDSQLTHCMLLKARIFVPIPGLLSREHDPAPLVKAAIPVLKLTRLFFKKISHPDMVIELQYPISDYAHKELKILRDLPGIVVSGLAELFDILRKPFIITWTALRLSTQAHPDQPYGIVENIKICFRRALVALKLVTCELPYHNGFFNHRYFERWFRTWDTLFTISINNLLDVIDSTDSDDSSDSSDSNDSIHL
ncbi:hypothetical protein MJO28_007358 [Puccinia striiformis f. sp. tritici]|uniref:Uncharacterized protein n=2 Tax=Puccinia striiformis TaxID=27350 RepID=A0A2S4VKX7_9BASI|nr:hypothetical protein MJO28_007358 [Puccinia striiformis f. sp. tritici]POW10098.1 hypothetical protein PSTT_06303 [Puccinia striiformis]